MEVSGVTVIARKKIKNVSEFHRYKQRKWNSSLNSINTNKGSGTHQQNGYTT
jgi:hypothetical protein